MSSFGFDDEKATPYRDEALEWLRHHGQQWIRESRKQVVFRGRDTPTKYWTTRPVHTDRQAMSSPDILHDFLNDKIAEKHLIANRSNAIFVTGSIERASVYGTEHIAIPHDNYAYTWSAEVADPWPLYHLKCDNGSMDPSEVPGLADIEYRGDDGSLYKAILNGGEIMVACKEVALFNPQFWYDFIVPHI